jgi:hypothetical protein
MEFNSSGKQFPIRGAELNGCAPGHSEFCCETLFVRGDYKSNLGEGLLLCHEGSDEGVD